MYVSTMCINCDYCVYHYKSTELVSLDTLDIGHKINIIIIIIKTPRLVTFGTHASHLLLDNILVS